MTICLYGHKGGFTPIIGESRLSSKIYASILIIIVTATIGVYSIIELTKPQNQQLIVSTTSSLYETGLLDILKTEFESQ